MERYEKYEFEEFADLYTGPDAIMLTDELTKEMDLTADMKALDLGCGNALSSLFLVKEYGCKVYAVDPKSYASKNYETAQKYGVENRLFPFCATADSLPFEPGTFDAVISINAWQAFGMKPGFFRDKIKDLLKPGAQIGIVTPATTERLEAEENLKNRDVISAFWSVNRLKNFFAEEFPVTDAREMECTVEAWKRWYRAASPAARRDPTAKWDIGNDVAIAMILGKL